MLPRIGVRGRRGIKPHNLLLQRVIGTPGSFFDVRIVSDVLTLATFGAGVSFDVRNC